VFLIANFSVPLPAQQDFLDFIFGFYSLTASCIGLLIFLAYVVGLWQVFIKAGESGWKAIIPIYNIWILLEIIGRPGWWVILYFIPVVGFVIWVIMNLDLAKSFDRGTWFAIGLILLPFLFVPFLGFSDTQYYGPAAKA
jgi:hypothetical protein